jgi:hypothetical protein
MLIGRSYLFLAIHKETNMVSISRKLTSKLFLWLIFMMLIASTNKSVIGALQSLPAAQLDATPAVEWVRLLYARIQAESISAPAGARLYAYAGITVYESVVSGIPGDKSLSGQLTDMPEMPSIDADTEYDWSASLTGAMAVVVPGILPASEDTTRLVNTLRSSQLNGRKRTVAPDIVDRSIAYGEAVGKAVLDWASHDNAKEAHEKGESYVLPADISDYVLTTAGTKPVEPYWGKVRPFGLPASNACDETQDMPFSTDPKSTFYAQAFEVKTTGDHLSQAQKDIATFWVDTPGITGTPAGHWMLITAQMVNQLHLNLDKAAEAFALVGIGVGDAFISGWNIKYVVILMRPETYINRYIDPTWRPYIQTPPFPEFISGHSIVSETASRILTSLFGTVAFTDNSERFRNLAPRSFTSFQAAASEAAMSRLYGGIHFRTGIEKGTDQGTCVAQYILERVHLH